MFLEWVFKKFFAKFLNKELDRIQLEIQKAYNQRLDALDKKGQIHHAETVTFQEKAMAGHAEHVKQMERSEKNSEQMLAQMTRIADIMEKKCNQTESA